MLDATIKTQLKAYLERLQQPIELIATLDDSDKAQEVRSLLDDIATLSTKVSVRNDGSDSRKPSFAVTRPGETPRIAFAGIPMGHEFTSLVLALLQTGGHPPKVEPEVIEQIKAIPGKFHFETFISLSCHNCPDVVQALNLMSVLNPGISHTMIDGALFQAEVNERKIMAVPTVFLNGEPFGQGRMTLEEIIAKIDTGAAAREAEKLAAKDVFDVLVGINLLREGLDIPEITLVAILDADKEGFLRSETSLIQTIGRAARNSEGHVIMYADVMTDSMRLAIDETKRRRALQEAYNKEHGITPTTIKKAVRDLISISKEVAKTEEKMEKDPESMSREELEKLIGQVQKQMKAAAAELNFEMAAELRDKMITLKKSLDDMEE